ncbi:MAG: alpha/beta hydrolase [Crocinitomicaceae bacterium]
MKTFSFEGITLHYDIKGTGPTLVFLHGFLEDHTMWSSITPAYQENYRCLLIDLPCHGKSRYEKEICHLSAMAQSVAALLTDLNIDSATVIGHSMGGYVGLELLKLQKHHLILLNSNFWEDPPEKKKDRDRLIKVVEKNKSRFVEQAIPGLFAEQNREACKADIERLIEGAKQIPSTEIIAATKGMRDRSANYELMRHEHISIIQGESDTVVSSNLLISELSHAGSPIPFRSIPDCGHMSCFEKPQATIEAINQLLIG